jgi:hypothetical protein
MISRQGGELINIMYSDDLYRWENYRLLMEPAILLGAAAAGELRFTGKKQKRDGCS